MTFRRTCVPRETWVFTRFNMNGGSTPNSSVGSRNWGYLKVAGKSGFSGFRQYCSCLGRKLNPLRPLFPDRCNLAVLAGELRKFVRLFVQIVGEPFLFIVD